MAKFKETEQIRLDNQTKTEIDIMVERDNKGYYYYASKRRATIVYFEKGTGVHFVDGEKYDVSGGDLFILNPETKHYFTSEDMPLNVINVFFPVRFLYGKDAGNDLLNSTLSKLNHSEKMVEERKLEFIHLSKVTNQIYSSLMQEIVEEYSIRQLYYQDVIRKNIEMILIHALREYNLGQEAIGLTLSQKKSVEDFIDLVEKNIQNAINYDEVITKLGFCKIYFNRLFQKYMGISVSKYTRKKRIDRACKLLAETNMTVEVVCEEVGYSDLKHFYSVFTSIVGVTPGKFKQKLSKV